MRRDLERRLQHLETANAGSSAPEIWVAEDDGNLSGPHGERITRDAFERRRQRGPRGVIVISATDARF